MPGRVLLPEVSVARDVVTSGGSRVFDGLSTAVSMLCMFWLAFMLGKFSEETITIQF